MAVRAFSVLNVRIGSRPKSDLTARARILDAAIEVFAEQGSAASVRTIAAAADVSPALVTHHFGSKDALKAECDQRVLDTYTEFKMAGIANPAASMAAFEQTGQTGQIAILGGYMLRAFLDGGATAQEFYRRLVAQMTEVMNVAATQGMVRPVCTDEAHMRYLAASTLGFMLVQFVVDPPGSTKDFSRHLMADPRVLDAMIDVLTHGVFENDQVLTAYREANPGLQPSSPETVIDDHRGRR